MTDTKEMSPEDEKQLTCEHPGFVSHVSIDRLEDSGRFMAGITIKCAECGLPFSFNGLPIGINLDGAMISVDGLEARLSISPGMGGIIVPKEPPKGGPGFRITQQQ